ncbi:MAG: PF20097 family protein [Acholeplasmataceae bacterium]|nr:PF20097 family protein [Acholeplasmataceae bacterium]
MECPKCGLEMDKGFIPVSRGRILWIPEDQRNPWNIISKPKGSVILSDFTVMAPKKADAYYCKSCKMVIVPVKN